MSSNKPNEISPEIPPKLEKKVPSFHGWNFFSRDSINVEEMVCLPKYSHTSLHTDLKKLRGNNNNSGEIAFKAIAQLSDHYTRLSNPAEKELALKKFAVLTHEIVKYGQPKAIESLYTFLRSNSKNSPILRDGILKSSPLLEAKKFSLNGDTVFICKLISTAIERLQNLNLQEQARPGSTTTLKQQLLIDLGALVGIYGSLGIKANTYAKDYYLVSDPASYYNKGFFHRLSKDINDLDSQPYQEEITKEKAKQLLYSMDQTDLNILLKSYQENLLASPDEKAKREKVLNKYVFSNNDAENVLSIDVIRKTVTDYLERVLPELSEPEKALLVAESKSELEIAKMKI